MNINESSVTNITKLDTINDVKQDSTEDIYNKGEFIPDNNFEDGYENSEIIELNDST